MKSVVFEFNDAPPSSSEFYRLTKRARRELMIRLRDLFLDARGEGPYPKALFTVEQHEPIKKQVADQLYKSWPAKVCVHAEITIRRHNQLSQRELEDGCCVLWEALKFAGWIVDVHPKWLHVTYKPQVLGDSAKTVLELTVPESIRESESLKKCRVEA